MLCPVIFNRLCFNDFFAVSRPWHPVQGLPVTGDLPTLHPGQTPFLVFFDCGEQDGRESFSVRGDREALF